MPIYHPPLLMAGFLFGYPSYGGKIIDGIDMLAASESRLPNQILEWQSRGLTFKFAPLPAASTDWFVAGQSQV